MDRTKNASPTFERGGQFVARGIHDPLGFRQLIGDRLEQRGLLPKLLESFGGGGDRGLCNVARELVERGLVAVGERSLLFGVPDMVAVKVDAAGPEDEAEERPGDGPRVEPEHQKIIAPRMKPMPAP